MMTTNGAARQPFYSASQASRNLSHIVWRTADPIELSIGLVRASGDAHPQVRSPARVAQLGDLLAQIEYVQAVIVQALAGVLLGMEPSLEQLQQVDLQEEIASAALVAANQQLAAQGVVLLGLAIDELQIEPGA